MSALVVLYTSFMFFAQSVRLYVHFGFYARCASDGGARGGKGQVSADDVRLVAVRAGMAFTVGMRLFFLFIVLVLWSGGVTYMAVAAVIITAFLAYFDMFDVSESGQGFATRIGRPRGGVLHGVGALSSQPPTPSKRNVTPHSYHAIAPPAARARAGARRERARRRRRRARRDARAHLAARARRGDARRRRRCGEGGAAAGSRGDAVADRAGVAGLRTPS